MLVAVELCPMNYSVCLLDKQGLTRSSELLAFADDAAASAYARDKVVANDIVEVWKQGSLVTRLYKPN